MNQEQQDFLKNNFKILQEQIEKLWKTKFKKLFIPLNLSYDDFEGQAFLEICKNIPYYDSSKGTSIKTFCSVIVEKKLKTYATALNRDKRKADTYAQSLNQSMSEENDIELIDLIADKPELDTAIEMENDQAIEKILTILPLQERKILSLKMQGFTNLEISAKTKLDISYVKDVAKHLSDNAELRKAVQIHLRRE